MPKRGMLCLYIPDEGELLTPKESWKPPREGQIKINFNGITKENPRKHVVEETSFWITGVSSKKSQRKD